MNKCQHKMGKQNGLVIVMLVLVLVVLLGIAALALDLGRLYVLKSEMQNAADAAALAAAAELNSKDDAIERATAAANNLLVHNSHFAKVRELLGTDKIGKEGDPGIDIAIKFYCSIGGKQDDPSGAGNIPVGCDTPPDPDDPKIPINPEDADEQAHYVKVTLNPDFTGNPDKYGIDLYFLPVLSVFGFDTSKTAITSVSALAGRHFYFCNYPPVMICDPFEGVNSKGNGVGFRNNVDVGNEILLKLQGGPNSTWSPGTFGFLDPDFNPGGGTTEVTPYLGNEGKLGCTPPQIMPETGNMATPMTSAMNTRFDEYGHPPFNYPSAYVDYPPAPDIREYGGYYDPAHTNDCPPGPATGPTSYCADTDNLTKPVCWRDSALRCPGGATRIGDGDWSRTGYWEALTGSSTLPSGLDGSSTRYDFYDYEVKHPGVLGADDKPVPAHQSVADPARRVLFVAVLSCNALGIKPNEVFPIAEPDGFAKLFITEKSAGSPANNFFVEFMGWAKEEDANYHVVVQLYE